MTTPAAPDVARAIDEVRALLGERLSTNTAAREEHSHDESYHHPLLPDAVAFPASTEEVAAIVGICARTRTPIVPFGAGTSLEGHVVPIRGGISVDLRGMDRLLRVDDEALDVTVQAGITRNTLNDALKGHGMFFPVDPGADATIGGMVSTRASGTTAVRYGTMRENVLALEVVLADGRVIRTGGRARKSSAGYDLTRLFVGAEGTLGIVTEVTLRVYGVPEAISAATCTFGSLDGAVRTVIETIQLGVRVARSELLDATSMDAVNRWAGLDLTVAPTLFLEFHGTPRGVEEDAQTVQEIAARHGGGNFEWATRLEDRTRLWHARHNALYAKLALRPGSKGFITDVCVPMSGLAQCLTETYADLEDCPVPVGLVGHVGDGNFHLAFMVDPDDAQELEQVERLNERMVTRALALGGTCTGEHGIGVGKLDLLEAEHGAGVDVMRAIKAALDPLDIMNPGKVVRV